MKFKTDVRTTWLEGSESWEWMEYIQNNAKWFARIVAAAQDPYMSRTELGSILEDSMESFLLAKHEQEAEDISNALRIGVVE